MKPILLFLASCVLSFVSVRAQESEFSLPLEMPFGTSSSSVLGRNSEGVLVWLTGRSADWMVCFSSATLDVKWKKQISFDERGASIEQPFLLGDSIVVLYTANVKGRRILKVNLYSPRMNLLRTARALDSTSALLDDGDRYRFATSTLHTHFMVYHQPEAFNRKKEINYVVVNAQLQTVRSGRLVTNAFEVPELVSGHVQDNGDAFFVVGDNNARNYNNAYAYSKIGLYAETATGARVNVASKSDVLLGDPLFRVDVHNNRWVLNGLYADKPGNEANGMFFLRGSLGDSVIHADQFIPFTEDFVTNITGQQGRKGRGFFDYYPTDMVVRRDGGVLFVTESQTQYSENLASSRFNTMGSGPGMITNHFFFNDLVVFSMDSTGAPQWNQVLRKKQQSDNDGGFYLSYGLLIGPKQLWLVYNDRVGGTNNLSGYAVTPYGDNKRTQLVDTERKNLAPVPLQAKQIAPNVLVIPSLRKGQLQLIKITFPS